MRIINARSPPVTLNQMTLGISNRIPKYLCQSFYKVAYTAVISVSDLNFDSESSTPPPVQCLWLVLSVISLVSGRKEMFYLMTHSTHFIYGYMASDIWLRTILIVRKETRCRHTTLWLTARVLLYAPSHRQDNLYYTSRGALAGTRNSSIGSPHEGLIWRPIAPWANTPTMELHLVPWLVSDAKLFLLYFKKIHIYKLIFLSCTIFNYYFKVN